MGRRVGAASAVAVVMGLLAAVSEQARAGQPVVGVGLLAGACSRDITPVVGVNHSDPIFLAGFGNDRQATGVHDPVWARGVVLEARGTKIALVTLDLVGYFYNEVKTIRSLVDPTLGFDSITVTSTHDHQGPDTMGLWGPDESTSGVDPDYLDFVNDQVVACITEADASRVPATIKFATGTTIGASLEPWPDLVADGGILQELEIDLADFGGGILHVEGDDGPVINSTVPAFQIRRRVPVQERVRAFMDWLLRGGPAPDLRPRREVIATLVNFASHPESLGDDNTLVTSDFPHYMREALERRYGGLAIYLSGDLGVLQGPLDVDVADEDGNPVPRRTFEFAERMGELLAGRAAGALDRSHTWHVNPKIEIRTTPTLVKVENPFFKILASFGVFGRRELVRGQGGPFVETEAQVLRIDQAQIAVTPNELDPQIGNHYRTMMTRARHRFIAGLGNDEIGYQLPVAKWNPSCHLCVYPVLFGNEEACSLFETLDCDTYFINNIGPGADPHFQELFEGMIGELNPAP